MITTDSLFEQIIDVQHLGTFTTQKGTFKVLTITIRITPDRRNNKQ